MRLSNDHACPHMRTRTHAHTHTRTTPSITHQGQHWLLPLSVFPVHPTSASAIPLSPLFPSPPTHLGRSRSQSHTCSLVLLDPTPHPMPIIDGRQHVRDAGCLGGGRLCSHRPRSCCLRRDARFQLRVRAGGRRGLQYHTARAPGVCYRRRWRVSGPSRPRVAMIQLFLSSRGDDSAVSVLAWR